MASFSRVGSLVGVFVVSLSYGYAFRILKENKLHQVACPRSYNLIGGLCYSSARETATYADGQSSCQPVVDLCTSEDANLANRDQAEKYIANGGTTLGKSYGLTSTTDSSGRNFFVTSGHQWGNGACQHTNRWFVCAVLPQASTQAPMPATTQAPQATTTTEAQKLQPGDKCGGAGWTSPTACESPSICEKLSDNYSECTAEATTATTTTTKAGHGQPAFLVRVGNSGTRYLNLKWGAPSKCPDGGLKIASAVECAAAASDMQEFFGMEISSADRPSGCIRSSKTSEFMTGYGKWDFNSLSHGSGADDWWPVCKKDEPDTGCKAQGRNVVSSSECCSGKSRAVPPYGRQCIHGHGELEVEMVRSGSIFCFQAGVLNSAIGAMIMSTLWFPGIDRNAQIQLNITQERTGRTGLPHSDMTNFHPEWADLGGQVRVWCSGNYYKAPTWKVGDIVRLNQPARERDATRLMRGLFRPEEYFCKRGRLVHHVHFTSGPFASCCPFGAEKEKDGRQDPLSCYKGKAAPSAPQCTTPEQVACHVPQWSWTTMACPAARKIYDESKVKLSRENYGSCITCTQLTPAPTPPPPPFQGYGSIRVGSRYGSMPIYNPPPKYECSGPCANGGQWNWNETCRRCAQPVRCGLWAQFQNATRAFVADLPENCDNEDRDAIQWLAKNHTSSSSHRDAMEWRAKDRTTEGKWIGQGGVFNWKGSMENQAAEKWGTMSDTC